MSDLVVNQAPPSAAPEISGALAPALTPPAPAATGPNWLEQDETLRNMWMQNQSPQAIGAALNRSVPAIMTRAARLGLPRRTAPGRKPGRRMLGQETEREQSVPYTPRKTEPRRIGQPRTTTGVASAGDRVVEGVTSLRICLMCLHKFESAGRHNRICPTCKGSAEYETASALSDIHLPGG